MKKEAKKLEKEAKEKDRSGGLALRRSGRQLQELTRTAVNRRANGLQSTPRKTVNFADSIAPEQLVTPKMSTRKRKSGPYLSPESSPAQPSPSKRSKAELKAQKDEEKRLKDEEKRKKEEEREEKKRVKELEKRQTEEEKLFTAYFVFDRDYGPTHPGPPMDLQLGRYSTHNVHRGSAYGAFR